MAGNLLQWAPGTWRELARHTLTPRFIQKAILALIPLAVALVGLATALAMHGGHP